ncbi:MAG: polysaccharide deacetylase family protein [Cytophaga sp.]|uniref:polysaccharide deacetylase family protein n=1 Tax=Cytophaga sp. TaxID=29535 RepID=UPI003F7F5B5D
MTWLIVGCICLILFFACSGQGVPIWLFHQVNPDSNTKPEQLEAFFRYLSKHGYKTYTLKEVEALRQANQKLPKKSLILTFDDGYYDNYSIVFPLLKKYKLKAIFFVNTLFIKEHADRSIQAIEKSDVVNAALIENYFQQRDASSSQYFTWEEMREMEASGLADIQCHSHRHGMVFSDTTFKNIVQESFTSAGDKFVHNGKARPGYPLFKMRGELSAQGYILDTAGSDLFKDFFEKNLITKPKKEILKQARSFFTKEFKMQHIYPYSETEFKMRVEKDMTENITHIEQNLRDKKAIGFAWPYGHQTKISMPWMKALGISYFFTCKKGTNTRSLNPDFIYRMELRKVTAVKLIWLTKINSNIASGWLYRWLS